MYLVTTAYLLILFHYFLFFSFHCHPQSNAMTMSSKMDCGTICTSSHIAKWRHTLSDTTNQKSPAVPKRKCSVDPNHLFMSFHHHLLLLHVLHPKESKSLSLKVGCCFFFVFHLCFDFILFDCCVCGCYSRNYTFLTSRWL